MGNCKDCTDCTCDNNGPLPAKNREPDRPASYYMRTFDKPYADGSSLHGYCTCDGARVGTLRYQCWPCIQAYANAVGWEAATDECFELSRVSKIAAERLMEAAKGLKQQRRLTCQD